MPSDFDAVFSALKPILAKHEKRLKVQADSPKEYTLVTKSPSTFPQHKGQPMWFGSIKLGKAYVSFHLMPLYMSPPLVKAIPASLKKRMQGKTCFNFKTEPDAEVLNDLKVLTEEAVKDWGEKKWL